MIFLKKIYTKKKNILSPYDNWEQFWHRRWDWNNNVIGFEKGFLIVINRLFRGNTDNNTISGRFNEIYKQNYKILQLLLKAGIFSDGDVYNIIHNIDIKPPEYTWRGCGNRYTEFRTSKKQLETNEKMCNYLKEHYDEIFNKYKSRINSMSNNNNLPPEITNNILGFLMKTQ